MKIKPCKRSGSVRLVLFFLAIIAGLFWAGGQGLYVALTNREPAVIGYDDYIKTKPNAIWLQLTNCILDFGSVSYRSSPGSSRPTELFIPITGQDENKGEVHVLLVTKAPELLQAIAELESKKTESEVLMWAIKTRDISHPKQGVIGLVRFGIDMKEKERGKLMKLQSNLATDFIMLDDGLKPALGKSIGLVALGVMALGGGVMYLRRNKETTVMD